MTNIFEHILVPYNGSKESEKAFKKAAIIAQAIQAKITILTCLEERLSFGLFKTKTSKQEFEKERSAVEKRQSELEKVAKEHNVFCDSKIVKNGLASIKILEFAQKNKVDLIIMTKTKLVSHYEKQHYHSTVENVFRNASCPVLIM